MSGSVDNITGHLHIPVLDFMNKSGAFIKLKGKDLLITVDVLVEPRRLSHLRGYWKVVIGSIIEFKLSQGEIWSKDEAHIYNLQVVWGAKPTIKELEGQTVITLDDPTTTTMSAETFGQFVDQVYVHWSHKNCFIPDIGKTNLPDFIPQ